MGEVIRSQELGFLIKLLNDQGVINNRMRKHFLLKAGALTLPEKSSNFLLLLPARNHVSYQRISPLRANKWVANIENPISLHKVFNF